MVILIISFIVLTYFGWFCSPFQSNPKVKIPSLLSGASMGFALIVFYVIVLELAKL